MEDMGNTVPLFSSPTHTTVTLFLDVALWQSCRTARCQRNRQRVPETAVPLPPIIPKVVTVDTRTYFKRVEVKNRSCSNAFKFFRCMQVSDSMR